ncbi:hypothetical protein [Ruegeria arenilitoris]|uniref:hypothetical protein n=1 Tax=Ruegeria arenilitoris TaxID=1173585 RepID=UPI00147FEDFA|nr:hypothetical protein [Ruegeria arenilitoris]
MLSRQKFLLSRFNQIVPDATATLVRQSRNGNVVPRQALKVLFGFLTAGLVTFVLSPFISAFAGFVSSDLTSYAESFLALFTGLGVFWVTAAIVLKGSTPRAWFGRGLICIGTALITTPIGLSVLFAIYLQDWISVISGTAIQNAGTTVASLFGGVVVANALALGLVLGCVSMLFGRLLVQEHTESPVRYCKPQSFALSDKGSARGLSLEQSQ